MFPFENSVQNPLKIYKTSFYACFAIVKNNWNLNSAKCVALYDCTSSVIS